MAATTEAPHPRMTALTGPHAALTGPGTAGAPRGVGERPGPGPDGAPPAPFSNWGNGCSGLAPCAGGVGYPDSNREAQMPTINMMVRTRSGVGHGH